MNRYLAAVSDDGAVTEPVTVIETEAPETTPAEEPGSETQPSGETEPAEEETGSILYFRIPLTRTMRCEYSKYTGTMGSGRICFYCGQ